MGRSHYSRLGREFAKGFIDGRNYMGDSSIRVTRVFEAEDGDIVLELEDDDELADETVLLSTGGRNFRVIPVEKLCNKD